MAESPEPRHRPREERRFGREVGRQAERKRRARAQGPRAVWFGLGMFGLVGWSVAIPTLVGIALGVWLDRQTTGQVSWTLTCLIIGVALGCLHAWYWVRQESRRDD